MNGYQKILNKFDEEGRLRRIPDHTRDCGLIDLSLNDYMAMNQRSQQWKEEFFRVSGHEGFSSSASRMLASDQKAYTDLEALLSKIYGRPALLYNSGYHSNTGIISALDIAGTLWLTDKLIHASAIDGIRMAGAECKRWNHNDTHHLEKLIEKNEDRYERLIVVCESVYSMDGDQAPLEELVEIKHRHNKVMLYVDEAHGFGVYGPQGAGLLAEKGLTGETDIIVGTLGKACGSSGAFAITDPLIHQYLLNSSRSLIFSTAIPPICAAWSKLMIEKLIGMDDERATLKEISERFRKGIEEITGEKNPSESPIVPLITGDSRKAVEISAGLKEQGIIALPIRRPTVPPGGERIRFSLNASLTLTDIDQILRIISKVYKSLR